MNRTQENLEFRKLKVSTLRPFMLNQKYDFKPWSAETFQELMVSIQEDGVLQPIIVRTLPMESLAAKEEIFEIIAGEHRWKACCQLNIEVIPALVLDECDNKKALNIFAVTNILSRNLSRSEQITAWAAYFQANKGKSAEVFNSLSEEGIIQTEKKYCDRHIYRYFRVNLLVPELRQLVIDEKISIVTGETFSYLTEAQQKMLVKYAPRITTKKAVQNILALKNGEIEGYDLDEKGLAYIFSENFLAVKETSITSAMTTAKAVIKKKIGKEDYPNIDHILTTSLSLYKNKALVERALKEYLQNHPEEQLELDFSVDLLCVR